MQLQGRNASKGLLVRTVLLRIDPGTAAGGPKEKLRGDSRRGRGLMLLSGGGAARPRHSGQRGSQRLVKGRAKRLDMPEHLPWQQQRHCTGSLRAFWVLKR